RGRARGRSAGRARRGGANAAGRAGRECGRGGRPAASQAASDSTEYAGRGAGRGNAAVVVGRTRSGLAPSSSNTARARPYQVVSPPLVQWYIPGGASLPASATRPRARSRDQVGEPRWSSTTSRVGRERSSRAIVLTKLPPAAPYTQAVRTTHASTGESSTARSPASLLAPYTEAGPVGASTGYGSPAVPGNTQSVDTCTSPAPRRAHAAARFAGPVALTANARSASLSAASTAVYAAALTQTSRSATGRAASAHSATALSTSAASVTSSSVRVNARAAGPATCNRS